jgi:hypothetical protein
MKKWLFIILFPSILFAGQENPHFGGRSAGMGHASVGSFDVWSTHHNQAGLGWLTEAAAGIFFQNKFGIKELNYLGFAYAHPIERGTFGVSFTNFGGSLYGESKVGLAYGMQFSDKITGGVQLNYHNTRLSNNYGSASGVSVEMGMQAYLNDKLMLATHIFNPTRTKLNEYNDERIPTKIRLGLNYQFSKQVLGSVEAEKDLLNRPQFRAGIEYKTNEILFLRAGVGTTPTLASFGFGIQKDGIALDVAAAYHQTLGFSPEISFQYTFKSKSRDSKTMP